MSLCFDFALKSILTRIRQYRPLLAVSIAGVCVMLFVLMVTDGMLNSMMDKMRQFYGGDFMVVRSWNHLINNKASDVQDMVDFLKKTLPKDASVSVRYSTGRHMSYFFEGVGVRMRTVKGVDFESEESLFKKMNFVEGGAPPSRPSRDGAVISQPVAEKLGVRVGDSVTLFVDEDDIKNTIVLVVTGIFQDSSVFGMYTTYIDYDALMTLLDFDIDVVNRIKVHYQNPPSKSEVRRVYDALADNFEMFDWLGFDNKSLWQDTYTEDEVYALIPLEANVSDLKNLSSALRAIVTLIVIMLVMIISIGISSTFRVIVTKRSVESGTFRALGMKPSMLMTLYFAEVLLILAAGSLAGFALSLVAVKIVSAYNFSFVIGFDLFLTGGYLSPILDGAKAFSLVAVIFVTTLGAVLFSLRKLIHISPVGALSTVT